MKRKTMLKGLQESLKKYKYKRGSSFQRFVKRMNTLSFYLIENNHEKRFINHVHKNTVINLVTALEVLLKDLIVEDDSFWSEEGIQKLLRDETEKITLFDAFQFSKNPKLKPVHWIVHRYSFQNIESIRKVFSALGNTDFASFVNNKFETDKVDLESFDSWYTMLVELFDLRNSIVHDDNNRKISYSEIEKYIGLITWLGLVMVHFSNHIVIEMVNDLGKKSAS